MAALEDGARPSRPGARAALRRMKAVALGLLASRAVVYLSTLSLADEASWGYVNAAAEAAMVGAARGLVAVTARCSVTRLRLPIPHTALIPRRKDEIAAACRSSSPRTSSPTTSCRARGRARVASASARGSRGRQRRARDEARRPWAASSALKRIDDDEIRAVLETILLPQLVREPIGPLAGDLLAAVVGDGAHHGLVDLLLA